MSMVRGFWNIFAISRSEIDLDCNLRTKLLFALLCLDIWRVGYAVAHIGWYRDTVLHWLSLDESRRAARFWTTRQQPWQWRRDRAAGLLNTAPICPATRSDRGRSAASCCRSDSATANYRATTSGCHAAASGSTAASGSARDVLSEQCLPAGLSAGLLPAMSVSSWTTLAEAEFKQAQVAHPKRE